MLCRIDYNGFYLERERGGSDEGSDDGMDYGEDDDGEYGDEYGQQQPKPS